MNYFALFLNENSFVEKCISLMRFISDPWKKSAPHITVRLFKVSDSRAKESREREFTYLNIIEPGTFNLEKKRPPYVVYLRCESEELEDIEYKPDFPYSRLHITIYEGDDFAYAKKLYELLRSAQWHFKLKFDRPRKLIEQEVGTKSYKRPDFEAFFNELLEGDYLDFIDNCERDTSIKLRMMESLLNKLDSYLKEKKPERIDSVYASHSRAKAASDAKQEYQQRRLQWTPSDLEEDEPVMFEKPVTDAIYITPPEYARDMAKCGLAAIEAKDGEIDFGDSAIGTGTLFLALKTLIDEVNGDRKTYRIRSAIGIDIDKKMADEASMRCHKRGLEVIYGDALLPTICIGVKRNLMLVNPPFNRHEEIPGAYRKMLYEQAKEQTGISISANAGLYAYHLLIMDKWLCDDAVAVWLLPTIFMQAKYGEAIRNYLLNNVQLIKIHVYNEGVEQFADIQVSTSIVVFRKRKSQDGESVLLSYGDSMENPTRSRQVKREELFESISNWRVLLNENAFFSAGKKSLTFEDLFEIKRGVATGANSFFVMTREKAKQYQIPDSALKPLLPKARYLKSLVIEAQADGYPDVEPQMVLVDCELEETQIQELYPAFYNYLQSAKVKGNNGTAIVDRVLVKSRHPWYKQERREPPAFLLTYMGRNKKNLPPLYFVWNKSRAIALNTYILLYPKDWLKDKLDQNPKMYEKLLAALNKSAEEILSAGTRIYSGGLNKIEPNELRRMPVVGLDGIL